MSRITESNELIKRQITSQSKKLDTHEVKIVQVEHNLSDVTKAISQLNPNHEAKQSVSGFGVVSLPQNAANSPLSVVVKGSTRTNLIKSSNMDKDSNADGVVDDFITTDGIGATFTFDDNAQKISVNGATIVNSASVRQGEGKNIPCSAGDIVSARIECKFVKTAGNPFVTLSLLFKDSNGNRLGDILSSTSVTTNTNGYVEMKVENKTAPANTAYVVLVCYLDTSRDASTTPETATVWCRSAMVEKAATIGNYITTGTKSTLGGRVQIKDAEDNITSEAYYDGTLRSLPNGTKDEVNVTSGINTKRVSDEYTLSQITTWNTDATGDTTNFYGTRVTASAFPNYAALLDTNSVSIKKYDGKSFVVYEEWRDYDGLGYLKNPGTGIFYIKLPKSIGGKTVSNINTYLSSLGATLTYQLANPIVTTLPAQILTGGANHTVWLLPELADAGIYDNGISILNQDLPIKSLKKVSKIDFETGAETALNVATAVIAGDKKSFTHPDLTNDDIVFFEYEYDSALSTTGELEVGYLDSRYVVKGADDNYYTWHVAVDAEGKASIVAEVVV